MNSYELARMFGWTLLWEPARRMDTQMDEWIRFEQNYAQRRARDEGVDFRKIIRTVDVREWSGGQSGVRVAWWIRT